MLKKVYSILNGVLQDKVFYSINITSDGTIVEMPFIVYKEMSRKFNKYCDNKPLSSRNVIQITLVCKTKDIVLEEKLEKSLIASGFYFALLSEYQNSDDSINRVYEIVMEEIKNYG